MRAQDSVVSADPYTGTDNVVATGSYISSVLGVRLSTPLFGTGFNTCIGARTAPATRLGAVRFKLRSVSVCRAFAPPLL